jgi:hypothetical protein
MELAQRVGFVPVEGLVRTAFQKVLSRCRQWEEVRRGSLSRVSAYPAQATLYDQPVVESYPELAEEYLRLVPEPVCFSDISRKLEVGMHAPHSLPLSVPWASLRLIARNAGRRLPPPVGAGAGPRPHFHELNRVQRRSEHFLVR